MTAAPIEKAEHVDLAWLRKGMEWVEEQAALAEQRGTKVGTMHNQMLWISHNVDPIWHTMIVIARERDLSGEYNVDGEVWQQIYREAGWTTEDHLLYEVMGFQPAGKPTYEAMMTKLVTRCWTSLSAYEQQYYLGLAEECGTAMCLAGYIGSRDEPRYLGDPEGAFWEAEGKEQMHVAKYAQNLMGLDDDQAGELFAGGNDVDDLRRISAEIASTVGERL